MKIGVDTTFLVQFTVREHSRHEAARVELERRISGGDILILTPQVISEFIHVVTDERRFERPLSTAEALQIARVWWEAAETEHVVPTSESVATFCEWMTQFSLGRKRILDTMLAATYYTHGIHCLLSSNARDYAVFGCFEVVVPQ